MRVDAIHLAEAVNAALIAESSQYAHLSHSPAANARAHLCTAPGCVRQAYARKLCNAHYIRKRQGREFSAPIRNRKGTAHCVDCGAKPNSKGGWLRCTRHYKARRRQVIKQALVSAFGGRCAKCATEYPSRVFDFHHVGDTKTDAPSELIDRVSVAVFSAEISGCVMLCANCHRMEHAHD